MFAQRVEALFGPATDRGVIFNWLKAERAKRIGMVVSDDAINAFLRQQTGDQVSSATFRDISKQMHTGQPRIFEALRMELLALRLEEAALGNFQTTPAQRFDYFRRLNQRAVAEVLPVSVEDFTDQVSDPPDEELRAFFEEHKEQEPLPESPEAGFKQPMKAAFEVVIAKYDDFNDPGAITDEQIKEHYEKFKDQRYLFSHFDFPPLDSDLPGHDKPKDADEKADEEAEPAADGDAAATDDTSKTDDANEQNAEGNKSKEAETPAEGESPADDKQSAIDGETSGLAAINALGANAAITGLLAADDDDQADDDTAGDAKGDDDKRDDKPAASEAKGETSTDGKPDNARSEADEAASDEQSPAGDDGADDAESAGKRKPRTPVVAPQITDELLLHRDIRDGEKPKYAPLWRVESTIRRELAAQQTPEKMEAALQGVQSKMYRYKQQRGSDDSGVERPDLEKLAQQNGLSLVDTGLVTMHELKRKYPELAEAHGQRGGLTFVEIGYSNRATFDFSTVADDAGNRYLFWKTAEEEARVPEFGEIRSQVLHAWKMNKARDLAVKRAQELVDEAKQSAQPLKTVFADRKGPGVTETAPFSWLTAGGGMGGPRQPSLSAVEGVEQPGADFMKEVFSLSVGGVGQAWNQPQSVAYVVRVASLEPSREVLRERFITEPYNAYFFVGSADYMQFRDTWTKGIEAEAGLTWHEPRGAPEENSDE
jgi:hypothetical protein